MSPGLDTVLTAVGFLAVFPAAVFAAGTGSMAGMMMGDGMGPDSSKLYGYLVIAGIVLPPLVVITLYGVALVLACVATGSTFYYPLIALAVGAAAWGGITTGLGVWIDRLK